MSVVLGSRVTRKSRAAAAPEGAPVDPAAVGEAAAVASAPAPTAAAHSAAAPASSLPKPLVPLSTPSPSITPRTTVPGTRAWINGMTLTSTGVQQLDHLFGGGVPLSSLVLLKEDVYATASTPFVSSFLADGIGFGHRCCVVHEASRRAATHWIANATPRNVNLERDTAGSSVENKPAASSQPSAVSAAQSDDLKIAWRYQQYFDQPMDARANLGAHKVSQLPAASSAAPSTSSAPKASSAASSTTLSGSYDYSSSITSALLASNPPVIVSLADDILPVVTAANPPLDPATANRMIYRNVLRAITLFLDQSGCVVGNAGSSGPVARIVLPSLGSLGWHVDASEQSEALLLFLMHLRQLLSTRRAIALLSMPTALFPPTFLRSVAHWCHASFALQSFAGSGSPSLARVAQHSLGDYDGLLRLEKAPTLHSLQASGAVAGAVAAPESGSAAAAGSASSAASAAASAASSSCFLFKCARRKIVIEKFALPPEDEEADSAADASSAQFEQQHAAPKPASVRSTKPPPSTAASAAAASSTARGRIELEDSDSAAGLAHSAAHLSRRPGAEVEKVDPRRAKVRDANETLSSIVRGRATGCSSSHQLPGKMDF